MTVLAETMYGSCKGKIPDSCPTFLVVSNEMIVRKYGNLKFDYACQILLTYQLRSSRKHTAII
jgi:hypothetical protein